MSTQQQAKKPIAYLEQDALGRWVVVANERQVSGFLELGTALAYAKSEKLTMIFFEGNDR